MRVKECGIEVGRWRGSERVESAIQTLALLSRASAMASFTSFRAHNTQPSSSLPRDVQHGPARR